MSFDPITGTAISTGLNLLGGLMGGKKKDYTVDQKPYWLTSFPNYKEGYDQLLADFMQNVYAKPYQPSSYMRRAEASDSPYLQQIQSQLDSQMAAAPQEQAPQEQAPQDNGMAADVGLGKYIYNNSLTNPMAGYGLRGGKGAIQGYGGGNDDFALLARMQQLNPLERQLVTTESGRGTPQGQEVAKRVMAGLSNFTSPIGMNYKQSWGI